MKKLLFAIFAHPDDEAFGPSATLLLEARAGTKVHLITLTAGENGMNPDKLEDLQQARLDEWRRGGELIGATDMHYFGFTDGGLDNIAMITVSEKLETLVRQVYADAPDHEIEFVTNDLNGISGHIDHIVAARAACLTFYRLKAAGLPMKRIRLSCIPQTFLPEPNTDFVFMEAGRPDGEIDEVVDARTDVMTIYQIMRAHHSQRSDGETHITNRGEEVAINYFKIIT